MWGPATDATARALASRLGALWKRHKGARGRRLLAVCGASGVGRSPTPDRPSSGRAAAAHYQLAVNAGSAGVGTRHKPHSARSSEPALGAVGAAQGPPGGTPLAWVWGVRGWAPPLPETARPLGVRPGCAIHRLWVRGSWAWGPVTHRAGFARCGGGTGAPGGGASWLCSGRSPTPYCPSLGCAVGAHYPLAVNAGSAGV